VITAVYDKEPYAHMVPIKSIFSGIESMFDRGTRQTSIVVASPGQIRGKLRDMPKRQTAPEILSKQEDDQKRFAGYLPIAEFISSILMVIVTGLVSLSRVGLQGAKNEL
jgi:hypothetical protein